MTHTSGTHAWAKKSHRRNWMLYESRDTHGTNPKNARLTKDQLKKFKKYSSRYW